MRVFVVISLFLCYTRYIIQNQGKYLMAENLSDEQVRRLISTARDLARVDTLARLLINEQIPEDALRPIAGEIHEYTTQLRHTLDRLTTTLDLGLDGTDEEAEDDGIDTDTVNDVLANYGESHEGPDYVISDEDAGELEDELNLDIPEPATDELVYADDSSDEYAIEDDDEDEDVANSDDENLVTEFGGYEEYDEASRHIEEAVEQPTEGPDEDLISYNEPGDINERIQENVTGIVSGRDSDSYDDDFLRDALGDATETALDDVDVEIESESEDEPSEEDAESVADEEDNVNE